MFKAYAGFTEKLANIAIDYVDEKCKDCFYSPWDKEKQVDEVLESLAKFLWEQYRKG